MTAGWSVLDTGASAAEFNMAFDEALLHQAVAIGHPVLRFYSWLEPAATFGYFQPYAMVSNATELRPLVRRPTGGGIVPHDRDWTYSLIVPVGHDWHGLNARRSYEQIHSWIDVALRNLGVATRLAELAVEGEGKCFVGCEENDVLFEGNKIGGAAQRRNRDGLLIQGSIQPDDSFPDRSEWQAKMIELGEEQFGSSAGPLSTAALTLVQRQVPELVRDKYGDPSYNQKR
ncbi:MAG: lipoate-protein ligase A [Limisphaerales bacterium]|jgi:lipoate-protein ligase A